MKWVAVSGSWRQTAPELERDVREQVSLVFEAGNGIVTGGALGVDYIATEMALQLKTDLDRLKVFLPINLGLYVAHYRKRAAEGVITTEQAERLAIQLQTVKARNSQALIENLDETEANERTYYARNTRVIEAADELLAFQVNGSGGVQDAMDKAHSLGQKVTLFEYQI